MKKEATLRFYKPSSNSNISLPLFSARVKAGFPSPADDNIEGRLDLNELVVRHPAATFFVRVEGDSMAGANIQDGDILVVDRAVKATSGKVVVAILNGEFTVKRIQIETTRVLLLPENPQFQPLEVTEEIDFEIWGVVTYIIHKCSS